MSSSTVADYMLQLELDSFSSHKHLHPLPPVFDVFMMPFLITYLLNVQKLNAVDSMEKFMFIFTNVGHIAGITKNKKQQYINHFQERPPIQQKQHEVHLFSASNRLISPSQKLWYFIISPSSAG